jgi:ketosteroid isomerase-like protein
VFDWLFEGRLAVYLALASVAAVCVMLWTRNRKRRWLYLACVPVLLIGVYFLLDLLVETRREQIGRKLKEMSAAVQARDVDRIFRHISEDFRLEQRGTSMDKAAFRRAVDTVFRNRVVDRVHIWDIAIGARAGDVVFRVKPTGQRIPDHPGFVCRATFVQDADGQWRMAGFQVFDPLVNADQPIDIPQLPTIP